MLCLEDLSELTTQKQVKAHIAVAFEIHPDKLKGLTVLIAYESVGSWGCDSSNWFLLRDSTERLLENHGGHCSCYGFEDQWEPEETSLEYLKSDKFYFSCGGYDSDEKGNKAAVEAAIARMRKG